MAQEERPKIPRSFWREGDFQDPKTRQVGHYDAETNTGELWVYKPRSNRRGQPRRGRKYHRN